MKNVSNVIGFVKREPVMTATALAAVVSCCFVPPDRGYLNYPDFRTLSLLYALMAVVAGLGRAGLFEAMAGKLCARAESVRVLGRVLVGLSFFSATLITNDVALLTFIPFAVVVLGMARERQALRRVVVLQTTAANLGSMLTPVGNPQNLFLYSRYGLTLKAFVRVTFPVWGLSLLLMLLACQFLPKTALRLPQGGAVEARTPDPRLLRGCFVLFLVCMLTVVRLIPWPIMLLAVVAGLFLLDRDILLKADFFLLLTFVAFFVLAGNLARLDAVGRLLRGLLRGREYLVSLLTSQVISNVPAALLLSGFTENARALILGVDVGGLGTPIASLASLIGLKLYSRSGEGRLSAFLLEFTAVNAALLLILSGAVYGWKLS